MNKFLAVFAFVGILSVSGNALAQCDGVGFPIDSAKEILLKENANSEKLYVKYNGFYIYLDTLHVLAYLNKEHKEPEQRLVSLIKNELPSKNSIDLYKYVPEHRNEKPFSFQVLRIIDELVFQMVIGGHVKIFHLNTHEEYSAKLLRYEKLESNASSTMVCTPNGELVVNHLNWIS